MVKKNEFDGEATVIVESLTTQAINQIINKFNIVQLNSDTIQYQGSNAQEFLEYIWYNFADWNNITCYPLKVSEIELFRRHDIVRVNEEYINTILRSIDGDFSVVTVNSDIEVIKFTDLPERVRIKIKMFEDKNGTYYIKTFCNDKVYGVPIEVPYYFRDNDNPEYEPPQLSVSAHAPWNKADPILVLKN